MQRQETDLLVVGSGAGALTTAVTAARCGARVVVVEKSAVFGGTSAMSGGGIWIPNSEDAKAAGASDSREDSLAYLRAAIGDTSEDERLQSFVENAPLMLADLQQNTRLEYDAMTYPDYYSDLPGAKKGFRTHAPKAFSGRLLGDDLYRMREQPLSYRVQGKFTVTIQEARLFLTQDKGWRRKLFRVIAGYYLDLPGRMKGQRSRRLTQGQALIGSLYLSCRNTGVDLKLSTPMKRLLSEGPRIVGAVVEHAGEEIEIQATRGVVLAAGGFEHNQTLREQCLPQPSQADWSVGQDNNTGDAIIAAQAQGAAVDLMQHAWWIPVVHVPGWERPMGIFAERSLPGLVMVDEQGKRFTNEAAPYLETGFAMYEHGSVPSWVVFDAEFRRKYPFGPLGPGWATPDKLIARRVRQVVHRADSIDALAEKIEADAPGLHDTIKRNNRFAASGIDEDFGRGSSFYDRYYGDSNNAPNPCLAPIAKPPFYAMPVHPGDIGTKGGLRTNKHAQVLDEKGKVLPGLYAVGNCAASVMGDKYPGAGATLGPAMTFGWLAARHACKQEN